MDQVGSPRALVEHLDRWYRGTSLAGRLAAVLIAGYLVLVAVNAAPIGHVNTGDTNLLAQGARVSLHCLRSGHLVGCDHPPGSIETPIGPYALLQYLPAMGLVEAGLTNNQVVRGLANINFAAFVLTLLVALLAAKRMKQAIWGPVMVAALIGSALTYQSTSGFGEMLAAFMVLAAVTSIMWRRPILTLVTVGLATTGKETLFPFLLVLGLLAGRNEEDTILPPWRVWVPLLVGIGVGEFLNLGFDELRFGVDKNLNYLEPLFRVPGLERKLNFLAALWVSPSAGVLWYWWVTALLLLAVAVAAIVGLIRAPRLVKIWLPPLLAVATVVAFSVGLADWYSPFGWVTYGPRLMVPILPAGLTVALYTGGPLLASAARRASSSVIGVGVAAVAVIVGGWAQFGAPWSWMAAILRLQAPSSSCPDLTQVIIQSGAGRYYHCVQALMWRLHPVVIKAAATAGSGVAWLARILGALASLLLVIVVIERRHRRSRRARHGPGRPPVASWALRSDRETLQL